MVFITSPVSCLFSHLHPPFSPSLPLFPLSQSRGCFCLCSVLLLLLLLPDAACCLLCCCCCCRWFAALLLLLMLLFAFAAGANVLGFGKRAREGHFEHRLDQLTCTCVFFQSRSTRLETRTKESDSWTSFMWVPKPASALKSACLDLGTGKPVVIFSVVCAREQVFGSLCFPVFAFFPRCVHHATPSTCAAPTLRVRVSFLRSVALQTTSFSQ